MGSDKHFQKDYTGCEEQIVGQQNPKQEITGRLLQESRQKDSDLNLNMNCSDEEIFRS